MPVPFPSPIEAVIFDMDGLLLDTERVYVRALTEAAEAIGYRMAEAFCHSMIGIPGPVCDGMIQDHFGPDFPLAAFSNAVDARAAALLAGGVPVKAGATALLDHLAAGAVPMAVATSSSRRTAASHLTRAGLHHRFAAIVTRDDVARGKPFPDLYLQAAAALGVAAGRCLAIEDSHPGVAAAHAAGTMPVMVPDIRPPTETERARCVAIAPDLNAVLALLAS